MKKKYTYYFLLILFIGTASFVVMRYNGKLKNQVNAFYPLKERNTVLRDSVEWPVVQQNAARLIRIVRETPSDNKSALALATLYIQEARVTGDYAYYDGAAMHYINGVLENEPDQVQGLVLKAIVELSQHHFTEAIETASKAQKINPYNAFIHGILIDGYVETGDYKKAVEHADEMVSIRPDIRSYSRIAYLREIHGDYPGAVEAMEMAVKAGTYGDEATAWARIQLARLYENTGDLPRAEMHYHIALQERPGYAYAYAGLGNLAASKNNFNEAISHYAKAGTLVMDYAFNEQLAKIYLLNGQKEKADALISKMIEELTTNAAEGEDGLNHHADKELAAIYQMKGDHKKALKHALAEYSRRPQNIDVNETLGWVYFKSGDVTNALKHLQAAMITGSKNPGLLVKMATVHQSAGNHSKAQQLMQQAMMHKPLIDVSLQPQTASFVTNK